MNGKLAAGSIRHESHMQAIIIDIDEIKKGLPDYKPKNAEHFHEESSKLAKQAFKIVLKRSNYKRIILLAGGSASGKTEYASSEGTKEEAIIFDGALSNIESFKKKLLMIQERKKTIEIWAIIPGSISHTFNTFVRRERRIPEKVFFSTHSGCRKTLLWLTKNHPDIPIKIIENLGDASKMEEVVFTSPEDHDKFILNLQKSEEELEKLTQH